MHPILFHIGPIKIFSYGFMIALGLFLSFVIIRRRGEYRGIKPDQLIDLMIATTCVGLIGARILYVLRFNEEYRDNWLGVVRVWEGGLVLYGGTITALLFLLVYSKIKQKRFFLLTDAIVPYFAFVQAFGRIGCFMNGCCGGAVTDSIFGMQFPHTHYYVHPTQLYSAFVCFLVAAVLFLINKPNVRVGFTTTVYFLLYPVGRFFVEFLRVNPKVFWGVFSHAQMISIVLFILAVFIFITKRFWNYHEQ
ncbi:MAG: prolipoprotein diacylglyceryl transferase [Candidatus Omnitrophica bacterium]|nr:prolipoprotein diacylglyceryl transferase [Candidatus Omnitrophota bacterium]